MGTSNTSDIYVNVIEDAINKVREEFINNGGPGEIVLNELQGIWEAKMIQAGAIVGPINRSSAQKQIQGGSIPAVHDLNVPYEGTEEFETPTADMLFPPTPLQTPLPGQTPLTGISQTPLPGTAQTPLPGTADSSFSNMFTGGTPITPNEYYPVNGANGAYETKIGPGRSSPYMQPPSQLLNQRPPLDVNVAYVESRDDGERGAPHQHLSQEFFMPSSGKRKMDEFPSQFQGGYIPQQDGSGDIILDGLEVAERNSTKYHSTSANIEIHLHGMKFSSKIAQLDGPIPDRYDDMLSTPNIYYNQGVVDEDYNTGTPAPNDLQATTSTPITQNEVDDDDDDDDEPLNEDDDDEDNDDVDQGEDHNTTHLVLAQFDKVARNKSRWKCTLKDGIMHINNKDILFNKATGEFDF